MSLKPDTAPRSSSRSQNRQAFSGDSVKRPWIVLVEDNPADVGLVREALGEHSVNCELTVLADGERAIEFIDEIDARRGACPDLMLLDLKLPRRDGCEVLRHVRASSQCRMIAVVILTSSNAKEDRECAARFGATDYLRKPDSLEEFIALGGVFKKLVSGGARN